VPQNKHRLDLILVAKGLAQSRQRAQAMIMAGKVLVNDRRVDKPGFPVSPDDAVELKGTDIPYVSRGGLKLEAALQNFKLNVTGSLCIDVGASTGGFTDCLLQHGAERVYAVDVGYGQLAWKLRQDPRVIVIERTNVRHMTDETIPAPVDLVTIDVAFISLKIVVPVIIKFLKPDASILALIKPQFEVGKNQVGKGGVVRKPELHQQVIKDLSDFFGSIKLKSQSVYPSPLLGPKGNREFFIFLKIDAFRNNADKRPQNADTFGVLFRKQTIF
jgi:23S rRNA (cytidine1920-2'-O)/16S rRNA (cytidine1409-2'-O)-methyltransferase